MQQLCGDLLDRVASTIPPAQAAVAFANSVDKYCKSDGARALLVRKVAALLTAVLSSSSSSSREDAAANMAAVDKVVQKKLVRYLWYRAAVVLVRLPLLRSCLLLKSCRCRCCCRTSSSSS